MTGKSTLFLSFSCESGKEWNSETCNGERWLDLSETDNLEPICYSEPALSVKVACTPVSKEVSLFCLKTLMIITVGQMSWRGVLILFKIDCDYPHCHRTLKRYPISAFSRVDFLILSNTDILNWIILSCGTCPVHFMMLSSIPNLYPLDTRRLPFPQL